MGKIMGLVTQLREGAESSEELQSRLVIVRAL